VTCKVLEGPIQDATERGLNRGSFFFTPEKHRPDAREYTEHGVLIPLFPSRTWVLFNDFQFEWRRGDGFSFYLP
jgi:hypothetical protein